MAVVAGGGNNQNVNLQINLDNNTQAGLDQAIDGLNDVEQASQETQDGLDGATSALGAFSSVPMAGVVAGLFSAGAAVALLAKAFDDFKASSEIIAVTNAQIKRMGFESDLSRQTIDELVASTRDIEAARGAILGLSASAGVDPKLLPELFQLSKTAAQIEQLDLQGVATDLGKALTEISTELPSITGQLLFMTDAQMENARALDLAGKSAEAQAIVIDALRKKYGAINVLDPGSIFDEMGIAITLVSEKIGALIGEFLAPFAESIKAIFLDINSFFIDKKRLDLAIDIREAKERIVELKAQINRTVGEKLTDFEIGIAFKSDLKINKMITELQNEIDQKENQLKISGKPVEILFFVDQEKLAAQRTIVSNAISSFKATSIVLFSDDEQIKINAEKQIEAAKQVAVAAVDAQQAAIILQGKNSKQLTESEISSLTERSNASKDFFNQISTLDKQQVTNALVKNNKMTEIENEFSNAIIAIHKTTEEAKSKLSDDALKEQLKNNNAVIEARQSLAKLAGIKPTDNQQIEIDRNIALEKSINLIKVQGIATSINTDKLINQAENYRLLDEAALNEARLTAQGDELLIIEAQIAATQQLSAAQQFSFELMTSALESQKTLWSDLANDGISVFSNALAAAFVRQRKAIDIIKSGLASIAQQFVATLIKIGIQRVISTAIGQSVEKTATISAIASSRLRTIAYAKEAAAFSLASAGFSAGAGVTALIAAVPASLAAVAPLVGIAHGGIDRVPTTGTFLLEKGEMVSKRQTVDKLDKLLSTGNKSVNRRPTVNDISVNLSLNISALDGQSVVEILDKAEGQVKSMAVEGLMQFFEQRGITLNG